MLDKSGKVPKVSVLVPLYRTQPEILRETVRSVLEQTFGDYELIFLDDCPMDPRESVVREFCDSRIIYRCNERNLGITPTRNRLLDMARGEYLAVLDHDDICRRDRFEKEVAFLDSHSECGVVSSIVRLWPADIPEPAQRASEDRDIRIKMTRGCEIVHSASMIRGCVLRESGIRYEERYSPAEDYRLFFRLMEYTQLHCIQEPLLKYRVYEGNTTAASFGVMVRAAYAILCEARVRYPQLCREYERRFGTRGIGYHVPLYWRLYNLLRFGVWVK